jgi:membrane protein required for colicin V production
MNILDIFILCTMVFFLVQGIFRGFLREIASLAGVVAGILLGSRLQPQTTALLKAHLADFHHLPVVSFVLIFALVLIVSNTLGYTLSRLFKKVFLGWLDRGLGAGLALAKGVILVYLIIALLTFFLPARAPLVAHSRLAPWVMVSYQSIIHLIPPEHYEEWKRRFFGEDEKTTVTSPGRLKQNDGQERTGRRFP